MIEGGKLTMFQKYIHLERWGTEEVRGLQEPMANNLYIFPKLDGTNASLWCDKEGEAIGCGSRRRKLSAGDDNRGFYALFHSDKELRLYLSKFPNYIFYGEWLVSHTIKTYLDEAWGKFYVFDVFDRETESFLSYEDYRHMVEGMASINNKIVLLPPLAVAKKLSTEDIKKSADTNYYLMKEGEVGEGVVIKSYGYINQYGRTVWAKYVRSEFTAKHIAEMGPRVINSVDSVEEKIVSKYVTEHLVLKTVEKLRDKYGFEGTLPSRCIAELLQTVYYDLITEELWQIIKEYSSPTINFKQLMKQSYYKTKLIYGI
jgi:hypothetical protein